MHETIRAMLAPVDPEQFLFISQVYALAAHGDIPSPLAEDAPPQSKPYFRFTNIPENRGAFAAMGECKQLGLSQDQTTAMIHRVMMHGHAVKTMQGTRWVQLPDATGAVMVSEALIRACAVCEFKEGDPNNHDFDYGEMVRHAERFEALHP